MWGEWGVWGRGGENEVRCGGGGMRCTCVWGWTDMRCVGGGGGGGGGQG